jgi:hypothetical protein
MLTSREARELMAYNARNPFDDQSNFHLPLAALQAQVAALAGAQPKPLSNYLLFRAQDFESDIDRELISSKW